MFMFNSVNVKNTKKDNGLEYVKVNKFFLKLGIIYQRSCAYTHQQNGVVEKKHKYLLQLARRLML